jgi:hypothetical protein
LSVSFELELEFVLWHSSQLRQGNFLPPFQTSKSVLMGQGLNDSVDRYSQFNGGALITFTLELVICFPQSAKKQKSLSRLRGYFNSCHSIVIELAEGKFPYRAKILLWKSQINKLEHVSGESLPAS